MAAGQSIRTGPFAYDILSLQISTVLPASPPKTRVIANQRRNAGVAIRFLLPSLGGRWHGKAVTDEGLASPYGRDAQCRSTGRRGFSCPLSQLRWQFPPEWEPREDGLPHQRARWFAM